VATGSSLREYNVDIYPVYFLPSFCYNDAILTLLPLNAQGFYARPVKGENGLDLMNWTCGIPGKIGVLANILIIIITTPNFVVIAAPSRLSLVCCQLIIFAVITITLALILLCDKLDIVMISLIHS
jgi:hypothetical protein